MSRVAGIGAKGRADLTTVLAAGRRFVTPTNVVEALGVDADIAAKKLARRAADGWLRRARRGLYIPAPVDAIAPAAWSEDALVVAAAVWPPCYFTGWTAANHWALTEQVFRTTVLKTTERVRILVAYLNDHDPALLVDYGDRLGNRTVFKRLGYLVEALEEGGYDDLVAASRERVSAGVSLLDPDGPDDGRPLARWGLRINVRIDPLEPS